MQLSQPGGRSNSALSGCELILVREEGTDGGRMPLTGSALCSLQSVLGASQEPNSCEQQSPKFARNDVSLVPQLAHLLVRKQKRSVK